jgi:hypothetical protein
MPLSPFMRRGLIACVTVATIASGYAPGLHAQDDPFSYEIDAVAMINATLPEVLQEPPPDHNEVAMEATLASVPSAPVVVAPAPVTSPPPPEVSVQLGEEGFLETPAAREAAIVVINLSGRELLTLAP